jgi:hypothetical protein
MTNPLCYVLGSQLQSEALEIRAASYAYEKKAGCFRLQAPPTRRRSCESYAPMTS